MSEAKRLVWKKRKRERNKRGRPRVLKTVCSPGSFEILKIRGEKSFREGVTRKRHRVSAVCRRGTARVCPTREMKFPWNFCSLEYSGLMICVTLFICEAGKRHVGAEYRLVWMRKIMERKIILIFFTSNPLNIKKNIPYCYRKAICRCDFSLMKNKRISLQDRERCFMYPDAKK